MIHDWHVFDDCHQSCKRCGLRLWRSRSGGSWNAVTANGVPAPFGLLPDGSPVRCQRPRNLLPELVVIDYTGDPDVHSGCERFMHRVRDAGDPASSAALANPAGAPTACGYPAVLWELGPARLHPGWTFCLDCFPERAGEGLNRRRLDPPPHVQRELERQERNQLQGQRAQATRKANEQLRRKTERVAKQLAKARAKPRPLKQCYCPNCAGGWMTSADETIRMIKKILEVPQTENPT